MIRVRLEYQVLIELIHTMYETYYEDGDGTHRVEALASLFGAIHPTKKGVLYIVRRLHPSQLVERKPSSLDIPERYYDRVNQPIAEGEEFLGQFHTHIPYHNGNGLMRAIPKISTEDYKSLIGIGPNAIEIILAVNRSNRKISSRDGREIKGTFVMHNTKYDIRIIAYTMRPSKKDRPKNRRLTEEGVNSRVLRIPLSTPKSALEAVFQ
ncbi:MAG: hypothetical protein HYS32_00555 [Candidatus Woesearchaeota archaeon]|nr:MAG: hypothetical protein HYS32_00555 [Candidatus Woesearchaeota archaeon]